MTCSLPLLARGPRNEHCTEPGSAHYLEDAIDAQLADGHEVSDEAKAHLSFAHFEAINPYGTMVFDIAGVLKRFRRPLRL